MSGLLKACVPYLFTLFLYCLPALVQAEIANVAMNLEDVPSITPDTLHTETSKSSPGIMFWLFVALLSLLPIGIFSYLFSQLRDLFTPKKRNKARAVFEKKQHQRYDEQTTLQTAAEDDD